jgi:UDP-N-acetylmuramate dehydrogenase
MEGKKNRNAGVHEKQALVLVNYGNASGEEIVIWPCRSVIQYSKIRNKLEPEVNIII